MSRQSFSFSDPFLPVRTTSLMTGNGSKSSRNAVMLQQQDGEELEVGIVSDSYNLVPNQTVYQIAMDVLQRTDLQFEDAGMIFDGKRYRQRWVLPDLNVEPQPGDFVQLALDVINSYNGSSLFGFMFQARRLVCTNGMVVDFMLGGFKFRHYGNDDFNKELQLAANSVVGLGEKLGPLSTSLQRMVDTRMDRRTIQVAYRDMDLPKAIQADSFLAVEGDSTWDFYNSITDVLTKKNTHHADNLNRQVSRYLMQTHA